MKVKSGKKSSHQLRHAPLGSEMEKPTGKLRAPKVDPTNDSASAEDKMDDDTAVLPDTLSKKIFQQARDQRMELTGRDDELDDTPSFARAKPSIDDSDDSDEDDIEHDILGDDGDGDDDDDQLVKLDGDYIVGTDLTEDEEAVVGKFLHANKNQSRSLADIIMDKLHEIKDDNVVQEQQGFGSEGVAIPPKVIEVYSSVGKIMSHYRSGKLPKALKMLPHLRNWEEVLWLTRPDEWSPAATYAATRIFISNLNEKMAQRFLNMVLLEKCRDDIVTNKKLNYYYYMAIRKSLYKPAAFYKGFLLPLAQSATCTLREATIVGSALTKLSIPSNHSAAVLLRLASLPYNGSTSLFIKVLLNKKYALPRRVIDALTNHYVAFSDEVRVLPVIWHQSLLVFVQRYKFEFTDMQKQSLKQLLKVQPHHQISPEVRRELNTGFSSSV